MYMTVYTYINVFSVRKVARRINTAIYIQNTCIHTKYIQNPESYTYIYVKIHAKYVHFFWEPVQKHPFSHCTYMNVYTVYERINQKYTDSEKIYVGNRYMYVYACICMYLHVYCCFQYTCIASTAWKFVYVCICMYMYVYACIHMYMMYLHGFCMYMHVFPEMTPSDTGTNATTPKHSL